MRSGMSRTVMAIGAHADDIEIEVGGTLAKYHAAGYEVIYVMSTNNMSGNVQVWQDGKIVRLPQEPPVPMMQRRKRECTAAARLLGAEPIHLDHPQRHYNTGNGMEMVQIQFGSPLADGIPAHTPSILTACEDQASIEKLADLILEKNPECILTHGVAQVNIEHFATSLLVVRSFWNAVERGFNGGLLQWREHHTVHGDFNCRWETFIDCSAYLERKMELIGMHQCQMPKAHLPDFAHRLLSLSWGQACGVGAAECFTWVRRPARCDVPGSSMPNPVYGELTLELIQNSR